MANNEWSQDFDDLLAELIDAGADFLIVGAHALAVHGHVRATGDLDILVRPSPINADKVMLALSRFGAPLVAHGVKTNDFCKPGMVYQIGLPPNRIDLLTEISGVDFDEALVGAVSAPLGDNPVRFIGLAAQLKNKRASGRTKDLADAEVLEELLRSGV
jgi:hypothetical protein